MNSRKLEKGSDYPDSKEREVSKRSIQPSPNLTHKCVEQESQENGKRLVVPLPRE